MYYQNSSQSYIITTKTVTGYNQKCPLAGKCLTTSLIYEVTITRHDNMNHDTYIYLTCNCFHSSSFMNKEKKNATKLSEHILGIKNNNVLYSITLIVLNRAKPYPPSNIISNLCLEEQEGQDGPKSIT